MSRTVQNSKPKPNTNRDYNTDFNNRWILSNQENTTSDFIQKYSSPASDIMTKNILKDQYSLNYTDYEKLKLADQYNQLYVNSMTDTEKLNKTIEDKKFYNMSLKLLIQNASNVYIQLINELSNFFTYNDEKSLNQIGYILTKGENMIYIGLLIVAIAFSMWLIDVTS